MRILRKSQVLLGLLCLAASLAAGADGVHVRFRLIEPSSTRYHVRLGGYIHNDPWTLPSAVVPDGADRDPTKRLPSGEATPWFDLRKHAGGLLHGRLRRSGGVAELPNVTADFITEEVSESRRVVIQIASAPDENSVVKRLEEHFSGSLTSFLVSGDLSRDAESFETASQMTERRLRWAREATGGKRTAPRDLIVQTSFWAPQRPELNLKEAEVLWLLGFNTVSNQMREVRERFAFRVPGHTHEVDFGPSVTQEEIDANLKAYAARDKTRYAPGVPWGFSDEVCARPPVGKDPAALAHFRAWLSAKDVSAETLGVRQLSEVAPIETPKEFTRCAAQQESAARRNFYLASRFRQEAATERVRWTTEAFHRHFGEGPLTTTLVADHPYFSGTGLGMGMTPNWTWGGHPLAMDWFDLGRRRAVDLAGIEDWMGLQYMYGPDSTWEGFQLMGFQAAIFRSASRGTLPIIAWITPSDERNLRLKSASALCQGAKHFFYWTYGPTATSTENYWSDLRSAYDGIVHMTRKIAEAEPILSPGKLRRTRLALLYSISSDLWQPFDYVHMLERRGVYLSLVHEQYLVDMITEEDVEAGRLADYDVLYTADPCIGTKAAEAIGKWVHGGGRLWGSCAAGSRNEFGEPTKGLAEVFGIESAVSARAQPGRYSVRAGVNDIPYADRVLLEQGGPLKEFGVIGARVDVAVAGARVAGTFTDGRPAVAVHAFGAGEAIWVGACPGIAYIKEARFVRDDLKERWPEELRGFILEPARGVPRIARLSSPVVEAGVYDAERGTALVLANFTYEPIHGLQVRIPVTRAPRTVRSLETGPLGFSVESTAEVSTVEFTLDLGLEDLVLLE